MSRMKVYLDTSVVSHLQQEDTPEKMATTLALWKLFKNGKYDVYLSGVTLGELQDCPEPKRSYLDKCLHEIKFTTLDITSEVERIAEKIIEMGVLTRKSLDDCRHIAAAIVYGCDCIISWNFKHIVKPKTVRGVRAITALEGYKPIEIWNPYYLLESEE